MLLRKHASCAAGVQHPYDTINCSGFDTTLARMILIDVWYCCPLSTSSGLFQVGHPPMSEREILLNTLARFAIRVTVNQALRDFGWMACGVFGLVALYTLLDAVNGPTKHPAVLAVLLILACVATAAVIAWKALRRQALARAAGEADKRANLKDELKSAYWFIRHGRSTPLVELLVRRASHTALRIEARKVFPIVIPQSIYTALVIALAAGALTWISPKITSPSAVAQARSGNAMPGQTGQGSASDGLSSKEQGFVHAANPHSAEKRSREKIQAAWNEVDALTRRLERSTELDPIRRSARARDARQAMQLLAALQGGEHNAKSARPQGEQMSAEVAQRLMARLKAILDEQEAQAAQSDRASADASAQRAARITRGLEDSVQYEQPEGDRGQHSVAEAALNTLLRAISRRGTGDREAMRAEGESWSERGRSQVSGGAMGRRVGVSQAGAGGENRESGDPSGSSQSAPVLGKPTMRLQAQLRQIGVKQHRDDDEIGTEEFIRAATQSQQSALAYEAVRGRQSASREEIMDSQQVPLGYRGAVKDYFLTGHRDEK